MNTWTCPDCETVTEIDPDSEVQCDHCGLMRFEVEGEAWDCPRFDCGKPNRADTTVCGYCGTPRGGS